MVWVKVADDKIINFEKVFTFYWKYRDNVILEIYVKHIEGEFIIYNKKICEDVERLGDFRFDDIVDKNKREVFDRKLSPDDIVKNALAIDIINKILSHLSIAKKENNDEIINLYKVFGTRKEP
jgi:hypothetical protein